MCKASKHQRDENIYELKLWIGDQNKRFGEVTIIKNNSKQLNEVHYEYT